MVTWQKIRTMTLPWGLQGKVPENVLGGQHFTFSPTSPPGNFQENVQICASTCPRKKSIHTFYRNRRRVPLKVRRAPHLWRSAFWRVLPVAYIHTILGEIFHHDGSCKKTGHLKCQSSHITCTFLMQIKRILSRCLCSTSVTHPSLFFTPRWSEGFKMSSQNFFYPFTFSLKQRQQPLSFSASTQLHSRIPHLTEHRRRKKKL